MHMPMQAIRKLLLLCWKLLFSKYRSNDHSLLDVCRKWRGRCYQGRTLIPVVMRRPDVVLGCTLTRSPSGSKSPAPGARVESEYGLRNASIICPLRYGLFVKAFSQLRLVIIMSIPAMSYSSRHLCLELFCLLAHVLLRDFFVAPRPWTPAQSPKPRQTGR